jgi:hypothetical protein
VASIDKDSAAEVGCVTAKHNPRGYYACKPRRDSRFYTRDILELTAQQVQLILRGY